MRAVWIAILFSLGTLAGCGGGDDGDDDVPPDGTWQLLASGRPSSLLATWTSGLDNVWVVGGREGTGGSPTVFHYDGAAWTKLDSGQPNVDLWQVFGFAGGDVFMAGSNGTILRYRGGTFEKLTTPGNDVIFGLWGSSPEDMWAVGGQFGGGRAFVWRLQGTAFVPVDGVPANLMQSGTVWKVTGRAVDDVWLSCTSGTVLHWNGQQLSSEVIGASDESLFSISCTTGRCVAVGGNNGTAVLYQDDGQGWGARTLPNGLNPLRGITPTGAHTYAVGEFGVVLRYDGKNFVPDAHGKGSEALHAAWSDDAGNLFAVGGMFDRFPTLNGVLLYKGEATVPPLP